MTLNEYQEMAMTTCLPTSNNFSYMFLNLAGEMGEIASKIAKHIRKGKASIEGNKLFLSVPVNEHVSDNRCVSKEEIDDLMSEAGDILWQLSGLCSVMGWKLEDVGQQNLNKLHSRQDRGVIDGNGDRR